MKMNLYAIRDRLIDYYMVPFPAPSHSQVKAAIASQVNNGDGHANVITQAPHQFEIWQLAEIDTETGRITEKREYLCDCSSLIRPGVRENGRPGIASPANQSAEAINRFNGAPGETGGYGSTHARVPAPEAPAEASQGEKTQPADQGIH